jgi:hypothetical protein
MTVGMLAAMLVPLLGLQLALTRVTRRALTREGRAPEWAQTWDLAIQPAWMQRMQQMRRPPPLRRMLWLLV